MMVPRAFAAQSSLSQKQYPRYDEKNAKSKDTRPDDRLRRPSVTPTPSPKSMSPLRTASDSVLDARSNPVKIPSRTQKSQTPSLRRPGPTSLQPDRTRLAVPQDASRRRESAQDVLSSTTIPMRRRPKQRLTQRIPNCDYVADFSKLLLEDIKPTSNGSLSGSLTDPHFGGLFGNIDELVEGQMIIGSDGLDAGILSARSLSTESMPSLVSQDDFASTEMDSSSPAGGRSIPERRLRQMASSEEAAEHPLMYMDNEEDEEEDGASSVSVVTMSPPARRQRPLSEEKRPSSFKSSLTASLNAIKSAAQSVSNFALTAPPAQPDEFLTHNFFDIQPSLTDDRRPPPSSEPPSPALRRYLNPSYTPPDDSPAQLHFWLDDKPTPASAIPNEDVKPRLKIKKKYMKNKSTADPSRLPPVVPLATCIPPSIRTANASSPPIWLAPDGTPSNKNTALPLLGDAENGEPRQREPRENRDFLRMFVCEQNMRKSGKLKEESPGRAVLWLPPVQEDTNGPKRRREVRERLCGWTMDEF